MIMTNGIKRYIALKNSGTDYKDPGTDRYKSIFNGGDDAGLIRVVDLAVDVGGSDFVLSNVGNVEAQDNIDFVYIISSNSNRDVLVGQVVISQQSNVLVTIISQPASVVTAGLSTSFTLRISPIAVGAFSFSVQFTVGVIDVAFTSSGVGTAFPWTDYGKLVLVPDIDSIYQTDAQTSEAVNTDDPAVRIYPTKIPVADDYFFQATTPPVLLASADGVNGKRMIKVNGHPTNSVTNSTVLNQMFNTNGCVMWLAGKIITSPDSGSRQMFGDIFAGNNLTKNSSTGDVECFWYNSIAQGWFHTIPPDGAGLFSFVMRKSGSTLDCWINGVKSLSPVTTDGSQAAASMDNEVCHIYGGPSGDLTHSWAMLAGGFDDETGWDDAKCQTLASKLESFLGR